MRHAVKRASQMTQLGPRFARALSTSPSLLRAVANNSVNSVNPVNVRPPMAFPCLDKLDRREESLRTGPEPNYFKPSVDSVQLYKSTEPLFLDYGDQLPQFEIAYETWGTLNADRSNAILLHTGLSASSHAHSTPQNPKRGWWEQYIGPGSYLDTDKYFVVCTNVIGGCFGSTGPQSVDPLTGTEYGTTFPILSIHDMVRAQNRLMKNHFGVDVLFASIGSSMGGMQCLAYAQEFPHAVQKVVSISGCAKSHPYSVAMRHCQRQVLMTDPNWNKGFYYGGLPPHRGMKLAREIATITYRSGPEWEQRFGVERSDPSLRPAFCPDLLIENYLDHAGEKWCLEFDPNSFIYLSKAMDLFDMGSTNRTRAKRSRSQARIPPNDPSLLEYRPMDVCSSESIPQKRTTRENPPHAAHEDLREGLQALSGVETLVIGVESDLLFPAWQQREVYDHMRANGEKVHHVELTAQESFYGHDTFLLKVEKIGSEIKSFLNS